MSDSPIPTSPPAYAPDTLPVNVSIPSPKSHIDLATILGLTFAITAIGIGIAMGKSDASFINAPALSIVFFGTLAVTAISYTSAEIARSWGVMSRTVIRESYEPSKMAKTLLDLAVIAKKKGPLALSPYESEFRKYKFMERTMQMVIDTQTPKDIDYITTQHISNLIERHKRAASMTKRAADAAPAMGLIGTLIGLVQMLANLDSPDTIGPAMAVALLTTFYGAILGTVVMNPLSGKLEKSLKDEALIKNLIRLSAISMAKQENPRKLEMQLNAALPPVRQIKYFN